MCKLIIGNQNPNVKLVFGYQKVTCKLSYW